MTLKLKANGTSFLHWLVVWLVIRQKKSSGLSGNNRCWSCDGKLVKGVEFFAEVSANFTAVVHTCSDYTFILWHFPLKWSNPGAYVTIKSKAIEVTSRTQKHIQSCDVILLVRCLNLKFFKIHFFEFYLNITMPTQKSSDLLIKIQYWNGILFLFSS